MFSPDGRHLGFAKMVRDMTERRQMQERLLESERRLQTFLHFNPSVIFIKDSAGRYLKVNRAFEEKFGLPEVRVLGRTDAEIFPAKQAAEFAANDRAVLENGEAMEFEECAEYADGTHFSLVAKFPLRNTRGEIHALGGIATDITTLRRATEQVREQARFITDVLDSLTAHVAVLDAEGKILAVNAAWREFAHANGSSSPNAHAGENYLAVCQQAADRGDTAAREVSEGVAQVLAGQRSGYTLEYPCHGPREERWFMLRVSSLAGPLAGAVVTHEDVTLRRRVADAVQVLAESVANHPDSTFFDTLLEQLVAVIGADHAFIGELLPGAARVRILAARGAPTLQPGGDYELSGTPWEDAIRGKLCYHARGVAGLFPRDRFLTAWKIEGYVGTPLLDSRGRPLGLIVLLATRPLGEPELAASLLRIVATRVGGEIERVAVESKLRAMAGRLLRSQDYERRVLGRELHDTTAQGLAALEINLAAVARHARLLPAGVRVLLRDAIKIAGQCTQEIRSLAFSLRPPLLDELGLVPALRVLVQGFARRSGIRCRFTGARRLRALKREEELALFRVAQEALANVHRHSGSAVAEVRLRQTKSGLVLVVADRGRGVSNQVTARPGARRTSPGLGLGGMTERMSQLGGKLELHTSRRGTRITATLPCAPRHE